MEKFTLEYSMKNVPLPSKKLYFKCLTEKVETFIKQARWKALFYELDNESDDPRQSNYGSR